VSLLPGRVVVVCVLSVNVLNRAHNYVASLNINFVSVSELETY